MGTQGPEEEEAPEEPKKQESRVAVVMFLFLAFCFWVGIPIHLLCKAVENGLTNPVLVFKFACLAAVISAFSMVFIFLNSFDKRMIHYYSDEPEMPDTPPAGFLVINQALRGDSETVPLATRWKVWALRWALGKLPRFVVIAHRRTSLPDDMIARNIAPGYSYVFTDPGFMSTSARPVDFPVSDFMWNHYLGGHFVFEIPSHSGRNIQQYSEFPGEIVLWFFRGRSSLSQL